MKKEEGDANLEVNSETKSIDKKIFHLYSETQIINKKIWVLLTVVIILFVINIIFLYALSSGIDSRIENRISDMTDNKVDRDELKRLTVYEAHRSKKTNEDGSITITVNAEIKNTGYLELYTGTVTLNAYDSDSYENLIHSSDKTFTNLEPDNEKELTWVFTIPKEQISSPDTFLNSLRFTFTREI